MALVTAKVETFPHLDVAGEPLDTAGLPIRQDVFTGVVPVVINHIPGTRDEVLASPSYNHGRSYELILPAVGNGEIIKSPWRDQYGNVFTTLVTKGNNFSEAKMMRSLSASSGYIPYGLQEGDALLRVLRASKLLREARIDTEWIVRVEEPKELYYKGEFYNPAEYKRRLIGDLLAERALKSLGIEPPDSHDDGEEEDQDEKDEAPAETEESIASIAEAVSGMDFFVTLRALATPYRVRDLIPEKWSENEELDLVTLKAIFDDYNLVAKVRSEEFEEHELPKGLSLPKNPNSKGGKRAIETYFTTVLPTLMGLNFARIHNKGLVHVFPTLSNTTALGGLVDLDAVRGPALGLGDRSPTNKDMIDDLEYIFRIDGHSTGELEDLMAMASKHIGKDAGDLLDDFTETLLGTYLQERGMLSPALEPNKEMVEFVAQLCEIKEWGTAFDYLHLASHKYVGEYVVEKVNEILGEGHPIGTVHFTELIYFVHIKDHLDEILETLPSNPDMLDESELANLLMEFAVTRDPRVADFRSHFFTEYFVALQLDRIHPHFDQITDWISERFAGTPFEGVSRHVIDWVFMVNAMPVVDKIAENVSVPDEDEVQNLLAKTFKEKYLSGITSVKS